jgi:hypothetical protein
VCVPDGTGGSYGAGGDYGAGATAGDATGGIGGQGCNLDCVACPVGDFWMNDSSCCGACIHTGVDCQSAQAGYELLLGRLRTMGALYCSTAADCAWISDPDSCLQTPAWVANAGYAPSIQYNLSTYSQLACQHCGGNGEAGAPSTGGSGGLPPPACINSQCVATGWATQ